jgi:hypothetical protein
MEKKMFTLTSITNQDASRGSSQTFSIPSPFQTTATNINEMINTSEILNFHAMDESKPSNSLRKRNEWYLEPAIGYFLPAGVKFHPTRK